ncbi:MAG: hypothetical protein AB7E79_10240 [Rhodospirillaceae bacterium]
MEIDPKNIKRTVPGIAYQSSIGIGVVFVALLTILPDAWESREIRKGFALYLLAVTVSLFFSFLIILAAMRVENESRSTRLLMANIGLLGLFLFALSSIWFAAYLVLKT